MNSTGKTSQRAVITALARTEKAAPAAPAAPVAEVAPVEEVKAKGPENQYGERSKVLDQKLPDGKPLAMTASIAELYGKKFTSEKPPLAALALPVKLTKEEAKAKIAELQKKKDDIETSIKGRVGELDEKWKYLGLDRRIKTLKVYLEKSEMLPPEKRTELETAIQQSEKAGVELKEVRDSVKQMQVDPTTGKHGTPEERKAKLAELLAARKDHREAVSDATATVDNAGLKVERLTVTEKMIDPAGSVQYPPLKELMGDYYEANFMLRTAQSLYLGPLAAMVSAMVRDEAQTKKNDEIRQDWLRGKDDQARLLFKDISMKVLEGKRSVDTERSNDVGRMPVTAATGARRAE